MAQLGFNFDRPDDEPAERRIARLQDEFERKHTPTGQAAWRESRDLLCGEELVEPACLN